MVIPNFHCNLNRPTTFSSARDALDQGMLPLLNHFAGVPLEDGLFVPDENSIDFVNSPSDSQHDSDALGLHAVTCQAEWNAKPVFVMVDFWDRGPALLTVDRLNGVLGTVQGRTEPPEYADEGSAAPARFGGAAEGAAQVALVLCIIACLLRA